MHCLFGDNSVSLRRIWMYEIHPSKGGPLKWDMMLRPARHELTCKTLMSQALPWSFLTLGNYLKLPGLPWSFLTLEVACAIVYKPPSMYIYVYIYVYMYTYVETSVKSQIKGNHIYIVIYRLGDHFLSTVCPQASSPPHWMGHVVHIGVDMAVAVFFVLATSL